MLTRDTYGGIVAAQFQTGTDTMQAEKNLSQPRAGQAGRPKDTPVTDSLPSRLAQLAVGESETKSTRLTVAGSTAGDVSEAARKLANSARSALTRAARRNTQGLRYTIDTGHFLTHDHQFYVVNAVITRVE
jgi:hypothetical protein